MQGDHENSIIAYHDTKEDREKRRKIVFAHFQSINEPLTDRSVMLGLGFRDMNAVRPRITELIDDGFLIECGKVRDQITGRLVRTTKVRRAEQQINFI